MFPGPRQPSSPRTAPPPGAYDFDRPSAPVEAASRELTVVRLLSVPGVRQGELVGLEPHSLTVWLLVQVRPAPLVRSIVLERDGHACVYCGADKPLEGDHIVPLSQGGSNALTNLATACRPCNLSKASSTLEEWCVRRAAAVPTAAPA